MTQVDWIAIVGSGSILGAVFWAGNTYNRISAIEKTLIELKDSIPKLADIASMRTDLDNLKERVHKLEDVQ